MSKKATVSRQKTMTTPSDESNSSTCDPPSSPTTRTLQLIPPQNADNNPTSCQMWLSCQQDTRTVAMEIVSSARNIEFYDDSGGYCCTVRGEKLAGEWQQSQEEPAYRTRIVTERPLTSCSFKFLSLADKKQLSLQGLNVKLAHQSEEAPSVGGSINMTRVREMMATMSQPVPERVENLMQTVEQYQKNQATVMEDLQQAAISRTLGTKDPMATQMTGLLSVLAKANSMQSEMARRSQHRIPPSGAAGAGLPDNSNQLGQMPSERTSGSNPANELSVDDDTQGGISQVLEKLMSTLSTTDASGGASEVVNSPDFYSAMQGMCRDLSRIKAQESRTEERGSGAVPGAGGDLGEEKETSEIPQEKHRSTLHDSSLELGLLGYVAAMEERIMGRLERKLDEVKDHIDVRLNRLEALLLEQSSARKKSMRKEEGSREEESSRQDESHLQEQDLD